MTDLARLPNYPSPTTLIARSGIQFLDFGFDPTKLRVREWGFHDAASTSSVDDLVQLDFDEVRDLAPLVVSRSQRLTKRGVADRNLRARNGKPRSTRRRVSSCFFLGYPHESALLILECRSTDAA